MHKSERQFDCSVKGLDCFAACVYKMCVSLDGVLSYTLQVFIVHRCWKGPIMHLCLNRWWRQPGARIGILLRVTHGQYIDNFLNSCCSSPGDQPHPIHLQVQFLKLAIGIKWKPSVKWKTENLLLQSPF